MAGGAHQASRRGREAGELIRTEMNPVSLDVAGKRRVAREKKKRTPARADMPQRSRFRRSAGVGVIAKNECCAGGQRARN